MEYASLFRYLPYILMRAHQAVILSSERNTPPLTSGSSEEDQLEDDDIQLWRPSSSSGLPDSIETLRDIKMGELSFILFPLFDLMLIQKRNHFFLGRIGLTEDSMKEIASAIANRQ